MLGVLVGVKPFETLPYPPFPLMSIVRSVWWLPWSPTQTETAHNLFTRSVWWLPWSPTQTEIAHNLFTRSVWWLPFGTGCNFDHGKQSKTGMCVCVCMCVYVRVAGGGGGSYNGG